MVSEIISSKMDSLSIGQRKVAQYILDNIEKVSYQTIAQIGRENNVSETTVVRLSYALGFSGFSELQKFIRNSVLRSYDVENDNDGSPETGNGEKGIFEQEIENLQKMARQLDLKEVEKVSKAIAKAGSVYVVGFRTSEFSAGWFSYVLEVLRGNIKRVSNSSEIYNLLDVDKNSVVVGISFSRYSNETISFLKMSREKGARIIAVSDSEASPIARLADHTFIAYPNRTKDGFNSISSAINLLQLIASKVGEYAVTAKERIREQEKIYSNSRVIFE